MRSIKRIIYYIPIYWAIAVNAQDWFKQNDLAWSSKGDAVFGNVLTYMIPKNFVLTNQLTGSSKKSLSLNFGINGSGPYNGTISQLVPSTGWNLYTPNNNFTGSDQFVYTVNSSRAKHQGEGLVGISIVDTNAITNGCFTWYFTNLANLDSGSFQKNNNIVWSMQDWVTSALGGQGVAGCINTNYSWIFSMSDSMAVGLGTNWVYSAGGDPTLATSWNANIDTGTGGTYFNDRSATCCPIPPVNDIFTATLCRTIGGMTLTLVVNTACSAPTNFLFTIITNFTDQSSGYVTGTVFTVTLTQPLSVALGQTYALIDVLCHTTQSGHSQVKWEGLSSWAMSGNVSQTQIAQAADMGVNTNVSCVPITTWFSFKPTTSSVSSQNWSGADVTSGDDILHLTLNCGTSPSEITNYTATVTNTIK